MGHRGVHRSQPAGRRRARRAGRPLLARRALGRRRPRRGRRRASSEAVRRRRRRPPVEQLAAPTTPPLVTLTVTEAGYAPRRRRAPRPRRTPPSPPTSTWLRRNLDAARFDLSDADRARRSRACSSDSTPAAARAPARSPIVSCDNMPAERRAARVGGCSELAELAWATRDSRAPRRARVVRITSVDRITPQDHDRADIAAVAAATGWLDRCTGRHRAVPRLGALRASSPPGVPTGRAPAPASSTTSSRSSAASCGCSTARTRCSPTRACRAGTAPSPRPSPTPRCARGSSEFWAEAVRHLPAEGLELDDYRAALLERFANARIQHLLEQIGQDGTTKLRVRIAPVLRAERAAGRDGEASVRALGAWVAAARDGRLPADRAGDALAAAASESGERAVVALLRLVDSELVEDPASSRPCARARAIRSGLTPGTRCRPADATPARRHLSCEGVAIGCQIVGTCFTGAIRSPTHPSIDSAGAVNDISQRRDRKATHAEAPDQPDP